MLDYTTYSAPVTDLSDWRCEGTIYRADQDPAYPTDRKFMYAPDVVQGNDGRFYLYYCMSGRAGFGGYNGPISVAVSDSPAGPFRYLGFVRYPDGSPMLKYVCFDPGVINDNGTIRIYYGTWSDEQLDKDFRNKEDLIQTVMQRYHKSRNEVLDTEGSVMGPCTVTVGDDMMTVTSEPRHIIPADVTGTSFAAHPFFEASSIRKIGEKYYFIYSSWQNHELCYATSDYPDRDFVFGGTIVSNGDVGYQGRAEKDRLNMTGTTHGSIEHQWSVVRFLSPSDSQIRLQPPGVCRTHHHSAGRQHPPGRDNLLRSQRQAAGGKGNLSGSDRLQHHQRSYAPRFQQDLHR